MIGEFLVGVEWGNSFVFFLIGKSRFFLGLRIVLIL